MVLRYAFAGELYWRILNKFIVKNCSGKGSNNFYWKKTAIHFRRRVLLSCPPVQKGLLLARDDSGSVAGQAAARIKGG